MLTSAVIYMGQRCFSVCNVQKKNKKEIFDLITSTNPSSSVRVAGTAGQISQVEQSVLENKLWKNNNPPSQVQGRGTSGYALMHAGHILTRRTWPFSPTWPDQQLTQKQNEHTS